MMPVFRGDGVPSGIKKPRARTGRTECVCVCVWRVREWNAHRTACFASGARTYVRGGRATGAAGANAYAYASRLGYLDSSCVHGPWPRPCVGAGLWIRTCDGCARKMLTGADVARCTPSEWRLRSWLPMSKRRRHAMAHEQAWWCWLYRRVSSAWQRGRRGFEPLRRVCLSLFMKPVSHLILFFL